MTEERMPLTVVVIGRNQAKQLKECLKSVKASFSHSIEEIIYVDTSSTDDSMAVAKSEGVTAIKIDPPIPSAAIARNVGWKMARTPFVLFLDGDTLLIRGFIEKAFRLFKIPSVAVVCGQRRERYPKASLYQEVLDLDWISSIGDIAYCGGDAIFRKSVLEEVKGFDGSLIAGEEPELCLRIRSAGFKIIRVGTLMTLHDLRIYRFWQYWRRCFRTGYAYAQVSRRHRHDAEALWRKESVHNLIKGLAVILLPIAAIVALPWSVWPLVACAAAFAGMVARTAINVHGISPSWRVSAWYGAHSHFQHIPMLCGQLAYFLNRRNGLVEYH